MRFIRFTALIIALALTPLAWSADAHTLWAAKVQPLFDLHCVKCHGPIEQKSGLELDLPEAVLKGGDEGQVVVPGKPDESRLFLYLAPDADPHMPPKKQLSDADREIVRAWISALGSEARSTRAAGPREFSGISEAVDTLLAEGWAARRVRPTKPVEDRMWCRRVYLDLAGRVPTEAELRAFIDSGSRNKRAELVESLLASDDYPLRMRELWDAFLMGRVKRGSHEERRRESGWWAFLEHSFRENRPWNETVRDFLIARPAKEELKGAHWFLYERRDQHQEIAEAVSPVVYGTRIDCAQCHDHPLAREIKQAHYWGLVAAFNRSKNVRDEGVGESAIGGHVNFTNLKKESQPALLTLLNGRTIPESWPAGDKKEEDSDDNYIDPKAKVREPKTSRRELFANAVTRENPLLARAFVNRMWAVYFGRGLVHPADEMNERNAPSHPELLDWLAEDFAASGYDVKRLLRGLVLSRAYGLRHGEQPPESFAAAQERPLTAEQIARSWQAAAGIGKKDDDLRRGLIGAIPDVLPVDYNATFQQAQFLENAPGLAKLLSPDSGGLAAQILALKSGRKQIEKAFLATLGRPPDREELAAAADFLESRAQDKPAAVRDLLWALMISPEFLTMP